ncbi:hypothetical protein Tco_1443410, partial [Tanacetum coccineum]
MALKIRRDNKIAHPIIQIQGTTVINPLTSTTQTHTDDVTSSITNKITTAFDTDDVTSSVGTKFYDHDINSPLSHVNSSNSTTGFDNGDVKSPSTYGNTSNSTQFDDDYDAVNSPLTSTTDVDNSDVSSPLVIDVNSSNFTGISNDDVTTSTSFQFHDADDVTSSSISTQIHEVNSGTDGVTSSSISTEFDNDDVNSA